jgi:four helix bundle protein
MSYKNLEIWKMAKEIANEIHAITLNDLPKFELYETGSQIRRSSKSIRSNIVEGYGRRIYKQEFVKFLTYAFASTLETFDHLESLYETKSFTNQEKYRDILSKLELLGKKLNLFISAVQREHNTLKKDNEATT